MTLERLRAYARVREGAINRSRYGQRVAAFLDLVRGFGLDVWRMQNLGNQSGATTTVAYLARPGDCYHGKNRSVCREPTP